MKYISILLVLIMGLSACSDYLDPTRTNDMSYEQLQEIPEESSISFRGLMTNAYRSFPSTLDTYGGDYLDCATDNAISNLTTSNTYKMQTQDGYWTSINSPIGGWTTRYDDLRNLNQFIIDGIKKDMVFITSSAYRDSIYKERLEGEAYFLRAWVQFDLLRRYAGPETENGPIMGYPIVKEMLDASMTELKRNTYDECVAQIIADLDTAYNAGIPVEYSGPDEFGGSDNIGRPTKVACLALKSRVLLYAASPAFSPNGTLNVSRYQQAADAAKEAIDLLGWGLPDIYNVENISTMFFNDAQNDELILRCVSGSNNSLEYKNYIPSKYGSGRTNPTQNLVDAFPMADGYPYSTATVDMDSMYYHRDPRFYMTVLYNGAIYTGDTVQTYVGGKDYLNGSPLAKITTSTTTGYYLRKWQSSNVSLVAGNVTKDWHYAALIRQVELYLNYAEAMYYAGNEDEAKLALRYVRSRAGVPADVDDYFSPAVANDPYLNSVSGADLEQLIKNERRIELCFEGHRFYDLRRWKENLNEPIRIVEITMPTDSTYAYQTKEAFTPVLPDNYYCPLPNNEVLKAENINQNAGW